MNCVQQTVKGLTLLSLLVFVCKSGAGREPAVLFPNAATPWLLPNPAAVESEGEDEHLETDRDSFTPSTSTVGTNRVVLETAYSFVDGGSGEDTHSLPELIGRYGLTDRLELRFGWNYETGGGGSVSSANPHGEGHSSGSVEESEVQYGVKLDVTDEDGWLPDSALLLQAATPTSGPESTTDFQVGYIVGWKIFDDWMLDSAVRKIWTEEEGDQFSSWAPSVVLKVPVAQRLNVHAEYFGIFTEGRDDERNGQYFSPGVHYLVTPDFEVGVRGGWGLSNDAADSFFNVGFGIRL
jgi:hypothetical protein